MRLIEKHWKRRNPHASAPFPFWSLYSSGRVAETDNARADEPSVMETLGEISAAPLFGPDAPLPGQVTARFA